MVTFTKTNSYLSTLNQRLSTNQFTENAPDISGEYNAFNNSALGQAVGQTLNGFMGINTLQDHPNQFQNGLFGIGMAKLTESVGGFAKDLVEEIEDAFEGTASGNGSFTDVLTVLGTLAVLTGENNVGKSFLLSYYGATSANGMQGLLSTATNKPLQQIVNAVRATQDGSLQSFMNQAFNRTISQILGPIISEFNVRRNLTLGTAISPVMQAVVDTIDTPIAFTVDELTSGNLSSAARNNVISLLSNGQYDAAIAIIAANSKLDINTIEDRIYGIDTRFTTRVTYTNSNTVPNFQVGSNAVGWEGRSTPSNRYGWQDPDQTQSTSSTTSAPMAGGGVGSASYNFTTIGGSEELEADFTSATRDITEVVVHWTATYIDQDIGVEEIHRWHQEKGWSGIGYHYVIRRDGSIWRGRPVNYVGAHAKANGHNNRSIGVAFVGGYTTPYTGTGTNSTTGPESFTPAQNTSFKMFMKTFFDVFPGGQAFGHMDTDPLGKIDPGFSVEDYILTNFGKRNLTKGTEAPLTITQYASRTSQYATG